MLWKTPPTHTTTETLTIEDFSDNTLSDFEVAESPWQVDANAQLGGTYSGYHPDGTASSSLIDTANHTALERGDSITHRWTETTNGAGKFIFYFGVGSADLTTAHYQLEVDFANDQVVLKTDDGSASTAQNTVAFAHTTGDEYSLTVNDTDGSASSPTFDISIDNITQGTTPVSFSWTDSSNHWSGGGFGWYAAFGAELYVDTLEATRETSGTTSYWTDTEHLVSNYADFQSALDAAGDRETVVVDVAQTLSTPLRPSSKTRITTPDGSRPQITVANTYSDFYLFDLGGLNTIEFDDVLIDGNRTNVTNGGGGFVGNVRDSVSNIRILNSTIQNVYGNGIFGKVEGNGAKVSDVYVYNTEMLNCRRHGFLLVATDTYSPQVEVTDVIIENCTVTDWDKAQGLGVNSNTPSDGLVHNVAFLGNTFSHDGSDDGSINGMSFEDNVQDSIMYGNTIDKTGTASITGALFTKGGERSVMARNYVATCATAGLSFNGLNQSGTPKNHLCVRNELVNNDAAFKMNELTGQTNLVGDNRVSGNTKVMIGTNRGNLITFNNVGSPGNAYGLPAEIGSGYYVDTVNYTVDASWSRGTADPADPVSVSVSSTIK